MLPSPHLPKSPPCSTIDHFTLGHHGKEEEDLDGGVEVDPTLPLGLRREAMPRHVAIIMDGNRRWARSRGLPVRSGYEAGGRTLRKVVELCCKWGIKVLSVFAFSSDNWFRPKVEVELLMSLFESGMQEDTGIFLSFKKKVVICCLALITGKTSEYLRQLQRTIRCHSSLPKVALKAKHGLIEPSDIDISLMEQELQTNCTEFPHPDLLIRTSGEFRISNFMLWQLAYTELFFAQSLWPDFGEAEFLKALLAFQQRQRRYGG
ncbi:Dehydrodolichyl diphosphate synthase 2 [Hibiscus syriacus]|uniref:Dehydrodolichyl diphosphate synthase 2 n=1 Tax=Hibiscus syriacus TaxID=106335 RepID=A0A6A3BR95_HIBSY|nr:Dehydrodolichyl diphosphate synthase 2 [Hibiscus syriacus]